jgi:CheY-like chemotaxis protein
LVLIVDDSAEDRLLIEEGFQAVPFHARLQLVSDGEEGLEYLLHTGGYAPPVEAARPDLILLDLHMPRVSGKEVLTRIKKHEKLRTIPVVIFTTSSDEEDVRFCYAAGANAYVVKPLDIDHFLTILNSIAVCWLAIRQNTLLPSLAPY